MCEIKNRTCEIVCKGDDPGPARKGGWGVVHPRGVTSHLLR